MKARCGRMFGVVMLAVAAVFSLDDQVRLFVDFDYKPILFYKKAGASAHKAKSLTLSRGEAEFTTKARNLESTESSLLPFRVFLLSCFRE